MLTTVSLDLSEQLLRLLASVLDIRQVFPQVSAIANQVLPHDRMTMSLHDGDQTCITHAASNNDGPMLVRVSGAAIGSMTEGFSRIIDDLQLHHPEMTFDPPDHRDRLLAAGYRAVLSVALSAGGQLFSLHFLSKTVGAFTPDQVPLARHIAVHVAMGISHEQLAESARQAAAARAHAERLSARIEALEVRAGSGRASSRSVPGASSTWMPPRLIVGAIVSAWYGSLKSSGFHSSPGQPMFRCEW